MSKKKPVVAEGLSTVETLFLTNEELQGAACDYQADASEENAARLRRAAVAYADVAMRVDEVI